MDLISREALKKCVWDLIIPKDVDDMPSAFEGMTVGEVLKAVLGIEDEQIVEAKYLVSIYPKGNHYDPFIAVKKNVWNAPYKAESEVKQDD